MISEIFAGVRQRFRSFALGQSFNAQFGENDYDKAKKWHDRAQRFHTDADDQKFRSDMVDDLLDSVVHQAKKFRPHDFDDDPQAAIEQALSSLAHPEDINGEVITAQRVMDHLGLEHQEQEISEALTV